MRDMSVIISYLFWFILISNTFTQIQWAGSLSVLLHINIMCSTARGITHSSGSLLRSILSWC